MGSRPKSGTNVQIALTSGKLLPSLQYIPLERELVYCTIRHMTLGTTSKSRVENRELRSQLTRKPWPRRPRCNDSESMRAPQWRGRQRLRKPRAKRLSKANSNLTQHRKRLQYANHCTKKNIAKRLRKKNIEPSCCGCCNPGLTCTCAASCITQDDVGWTSNLQTIQISIDRKDCIHVCISTPEDLEIKAIVDVSRASFHYSSEVRWVARVDGSIHAR